MAVTHLGARYRVAEACHQLRMDGQHSPLYSRWPWFVSAFGRSAGIARAGRLTIFDMAGIDALVATYVHINHVGVFLTC